MKYCVTVVRAGCIFVEAKNETMAMEIANAQKTDAVNWSDDWEATDAELCDFNIPCYCFDESAQVAEAEKRG